VNATMRGILIDWLIEVCMKYKLRTETLFLCVQLVDQFLFREQVSVKQLQLVGVTALLIASKFEELSPPEISEFEYITAEACSMAAISAMELRLLVALEFAVCRPTAAQFFERFAYLNKCDQKHRHLLQYVLELSLLDVTMVQYSPCHLVASATLLTNLMLRRRPAWPEEMVDKTGFEEVSVRPCAKELCRLLELQGSFASSSPSVAENKFVTDQRNSTFGATVYKKFLRPEFGCVAQIDV